MSCVFGWGLGFLGGYHGDLKVPAPPLLLQPILDFVNDKIADFYRNIFEASGSVEGMELGSGDAQALDLHSPGAVGWVWGKEDSMS